MVFLDEASGARPRPVRRRAGPKEWAGLAVLALPTALLGLDVTILYLALPALAADLQPSSTQALWIMDAYGFMIAGFLITMGTLGDRIGRRRLLMAGVAAFGVVSLLAAFAPSAQALIAARALLGIAGATLMPSTLALISNIFVDVRQRALAIGIWAMMFAFGMAAGPLVGGVMLEHFWWGSVFLLALPVMAALLLLGPRVLPEYRDPNSGRLDLTSAALSLAAILAVIYGLKQVAIEGFGAVPALSIVAGVVLALVFVRRQTRIEDPMIDLRLFRIRVFSASLTTYLLSIFVAFGYFLFVAQYLQLVLGLSPLKAGLWSLPSGAGFIVGSLLAPKVIHRFRPAAVMGTGLLIAAGGLLLLTQVGGPSSLTVIVVSVSVMALALAPVVTLSTELVVGSAPPERAGAASGISETSAELGGALGIAVLGSIGVAVYRTQMAEAIPAAVPARAAEVATDTLGGAVSVAGQLPQEVADRLLETARAAFTSGLRVTAVIAAVVAACVALVAATMLRGIRGRSETSHVAEAELVGQTAPDA
jgi:MFS transporter, DHA2 family, multidrug resistance protein